MLDKIQSNNSESVIQSQNLDRVKSIGLMNNPYEDSDDDFFVDESYISEAAFEKYQRELDVSKFSEILKNTNQKESDALVLQQAFDGIFSIDNDDFLYDLINNENFLNDIA